MDQLILHHHLGLGDHFICKGLVHELKQELQIKTLILAVKEHNLPTVSALYKNHHDIVLLPLPRAAYSRESEYILEQSSLREIPLLRISLTNKSARAFDLGFFHQAGVPLEKSWSAFQPPAPSESARTLYRKLIAHKEYCLVSATGSVGDFDLDLGTPLPVYRIQPGLSDNLLDWSEVIGDATEIHCIDSSVIHLVDRIPTRAKRLVYHDVGRGSQFHLIKTWEKKMAVPMNALPARLANIVESHFDALPDEHILELNKGAIQWLNPTKSTPPALRRLTQKFIKKSLKRNLGRWRHVCYYSFRRMVNEIPDLRSEPRILETGSSAHGTNSSILFFKLIDLLGGSFDTVDLNPDATARVKEALTSGFPQLQGKAHCHNMDSVALIKSLEGPFDVVYLDSYDLYPGIFKESEEHGLQEFDAVLNKLADEALILIDDTPRTRKIFDRMNDRTFMNAVDHHIQKFGRLPGKGSLVIQKIANDRRFSTLHHEYQLLLKYKKAS